MKSVRDNVNMLSGSAAKSIVYFALPLISANLFQQLYNTVDTLIVGKFNGDDALAAVGVSFSVTMVMLAFATGTGIGSSVLISKLFGAGNRSGLKTAVATILCFSAVFGTVLAAAGYFFSVPLLTALGTPQNIMADAAGYLKIYSCGLPFMFLYNVLASVFSALGNSKTPFKLLMFSSLTNIVLDLVFVGLLGTGVEGAALATLIAQCFSSAASFFLLLRSVFLSRGRDVPFRLFSFSSLKQMAGYAITSVIQQAVVSVGMMLVQSVINRFGSEVLAGYTAASKIDAFAVMPFIACGNAVSTFTAQNLGAGQRERVSSGFKASIILVAVISAAELIIILPLRKILLELFLDGSSADAFGTGMSYLTLIAFCYILMGIKSCYDGLLRGTGQLKTFLAGSILNLFFRTVFSFAAASYIGAAAVWISIPFGWTINLLFCIIMRKLTAKTPSQ